MLILKLENIKNILIFFVKYQFINFLKYVSYIDNSHSSKKYIFFILKYIYHNLNFYTTKNKIWKSILWMWIKWMLKEMN